MHLPLVISFPDSEPTTLAEVGGKGYSLIRMLEAGLPVPPGFVITTSFFASWFDVVRGSAAWAKLADAPMEGWGDLCGELKDLCPDLPLSPEQRAALDELRSRLRGLGDDALFAVRSSSPEEDLASASFAGGYETRLGVRVADLENAVRECFASCLDHRVFVYKHEHGFDVLTPRIAVIVQRQIDSEVAGVAFSVNPLTNDYDEAAIDANWGLGESVVAGLAIPDHFGVDKTSGAIVESVVGEKQASVWLDGEGGTSERRDHRPRDVTLDGTQVRELTETLCRIETLYATPVDIEWAYAAGRLHVLQARPITTWVPLPPEMTTTPGTRRRLYIDAALSKGMTTNAPISPMGLDWMDTLMSSFLGRVLGMGETGADRLVFVAGGRIYVNMSMLLWLTTPQKMARSSRYNDALMADILASVDAERYRTWPRPRWLRLRIAGRTPRILWLWRRFFWNVVWNVLRPEHAHREYERRVAAFESEFQEGLDYSLSLEDFRRRYVPPMVRITFDVTMAALMASFMALGLVERMYRRRSAEERALADKLQRGFTGNAVVEMGLAMYRLAGQLDPHYFEDHAALATRIEKRRMPPGFTDAWDAFMVRHGCRGPLEMDLASPRYGDDARLAVRQMSFMTGGDAGFSPEAAHAEAVAERREACAELMRRGGWLRRKLLRRLHRLIELFAGTRDTPKHHIVMFNYALRKRGLIEGRRLVAEGRLDTPEHVFDLTYSDLEAAAADPELDLRARREERTRFNRKLEDHVVTFPAMIDSRGRILRPAPREERPGEMTGMAVSPGIATGPVKVLRNPHEKTVERGDVLVAYTTDPGWTPLFVNAAAVVLEIGGTLQHGAVVAREYGKPCVVGIDRVMSRLQDGQRVEVDGTTGVVRLQKGSDPFSE